MGVGEGGAPPVAALMTHNVIMVKTLLLLTFEMGGALGDSWTMVLEVCLIHMCDMTHMDYIFVT